MSSRWKQTQYPGVRYRTHPTRKFGVGYDKYFAIYYNIHGKRKEEGLGWATQGWSAKKANEVLAQLKRNQRKGEGPQTLAEMKAEAQAKRAAEERKKQELEKRQITLTQFFEKHYLPIAKTNKKASTVKAEVILFNRWLQPILGHKPLVEIYPLDLERLKRKMAEAAKSPRTIEYTLAVFRQVWNQARRHSIVHRESPTKEVTKIRFDNRRLRILNPDEAACLLEALQSKSQQTYEMALLGLDCGLRFGEIANLTWADIDLTNGELTVRDSKTRYSRIVPMTKRIAEMLKAKVPEEGSQGNELIFKDRHGRKLRAVSKTFQRTVEELGLNRGITDKRQRVVFHTLRHTYGTTLALNGTPVNILSDLLGHRLLTTTSRYLHSSSRAKQEAVNRLQETFVK